MSTETLGAIGIIAFCSLVFWFLNTACKWGEQTRKDEEEFEKQKDITTPDEHGNQITILRSSDGA